MKFDRSRFGSAVILMVVVLILPVHICLGSSIREYRQNLLNNLKEKSKIINDGRICRTEHFAVYIDSLSLKDLNLERGEGLTDLMLRISYVFEEAYEVVGENFNRYPSGRFTIKILSEQSYTRSAGEGYSLTVGKSKLKIPFSKDEMRDALSDFEDGVSKIYYAYSRVFLYTITGPEFYNKASNEISKYFQKIGEKTSRWTKNLTEGEKKGILNSIDEKNEFLFKKYPQYFKSKSKARKTMKCKWCGKEVDVTGKRKGERILCPHCRSPIFVR